MTLEQWVELWQACKGHDVYLAGRPDGDVGVQCGYDEFSVEFQYDGKPDANKKALKKWLKKKKQGGAE